MATISQLVKVVGELWDALLQALTLTSIGNDDGWREGGREREREREREVWGRGGGEKDQIIQLHS